MFPDALKLLDRPIDHDRKYYIILLLYIGNTYILYVLPIKKKNCQDVQF